MFVQLALQLCKTNYVSQTLIHYSTCVCSGQLYKSGQLCFCNQLGHDIMYIQYNLVKTSLQA